MSDAKEREWQGLLAFYRVWLTDISPLTWSLEDARHPLKVLDGIAQSEGRSVALRGLRQAVGDVVEMTSGMPSDTLASVDRHLASIGVMTLTALRQRLGSVYKSVLNRGRIRSDEEFHLLKGVADDTSVAISDAERQRVNDLLGRYELVTGRGDR